MTTALSTLSRFGTLGDGRVRDAENSGQRAEDHRGETHATRDLGPCLRPLLRVLEWRGTLREVAEASPHFIDRLELADLLGVMKNLGFTHETMKVRLDQLDPRLAPCLFVPDDHPPVVVLASDNGVIRAYSGDDTAREHVLAQPRWPGRAILFSAVEGPTVDRRRRAGWLTQVLDTFTAPITQLLGIGLLSNVLALSTPLFVMAVYDRVVPSASEVMLTALAIGVGIALAADILLRLLRARVLAWVGARIDVLIGNAVFQRVLALHASLTERATLGSQLSRLKHFESVREIFTGPIALVALELPFALLFVAVIAVIAGPLAIIPVVMIVLFALIGVIMATKVRAAVTAATLGTTRRHEFMLETLSHFRTIKFAGAETIWLNRFRDLTADVAMAGFRLSRLTAIAQTLSYVLMILAGLATMAVGVLLVMDASISLGALVASMILVWRVLAPLQSAFMALNRISQVRSAIEQINALMAMRPERNTDRPPVAFREVKGRITFSRVSLRYTPDTDPALVGVSFDVRPGQLLAVIGGNGSGKSTLLKVVLGLVTPQAGQVLIDGRDTRQIDPAELRQTIAYVPQVSHLFYGTIAQNLRLAAPLAADDDLLRAAAEAGVLDDIRALDSADESGARSGFDVRTGDALVRQLPTSFQQQLNLARAYVKSAPILLLDEPGVGLDPDADRALIANLKRMKGDRTVLLVSHRPSHIALADKVLWLDRGQAMGFGTPDEVMKALPRSFF